MAFVIVVIFCQLLSSRSDHCDWCDVQESDDDYGTVSRSPRGRGRGRGRGLASTPGRKEHIHAVMDDAQLQSDDDVVTVNSVKLGKRFLPQLSYKLCLHR